MVLILVVVEDVLVLGKTYTCLINFDVLILVVVEDVLVLDCEPFESIKFDSLNPCCGGRCSSTV